MVGKFINSVLAKYGYTITLISDITGDQEFMKLYNLCKPYTMTSIERMYALYNSLNYVVNNKIEGDFLECGVWKGGSSMMIAEFLASKNITNRKLYMYDTYEGMSAPTENDLNLEGKSADKMLKSSSKNVSDSVWCYSALDEVKKNMSLTKFSQDNIVYVQGKVEDTIPNVIPKDKIALLRLDTDWYESTKHELTHLYPMLQSKGVLIIDDFGYWDGAKKAVLEYFSQNKINMVLHRIDYTGRLGYKN